MTGRLTEWEIDVLARHLPVLRVIAGEHPDGPMAVDRRRARLDHYKEWHARIAHLTYYEPLRGHIKHKIARIEDELAEAPRSFLRLGTVTPPLTPKKQKVDPRARWALDAYVNEGLTLEQLGEQLEITRERVRQLIDSYDPTLYALAQRRRHARVRLRSYVKDGRPQQRCIICGVLCEGDRRTLCSDEHRLIWERMRYHTNPITRDRMRAAMARRTLETGVGSISYATNVLNHHHESGRRWLQEDSQNFAWALQAYHEKWPLFDALPDEIQDQIRAYVESGPKPRKDHIPRDQLPRNVMRRRLLAGEELSGTLVAKELGTVTGVFSNLKRDMAAEGYRFLKRRGEGNLAFSRLDPSQTLRGVDDPALS